MKKIHAFIICWEGKEENTKHISEEIISKVDYLTVIYSNSNNLKVYGQGEWIQVPNDWYFGKKFKKTLGLIKSDYVMHIHGDTFTDNWPLIVDKFQESIANIPSLGIWCPEINFTPWKTNEVEILRSTDGRYSFVAQSDCLVWGITKNVILRLNDFNYELNNIGWGIDWGAVCFSYINNLSVVRDLSVFLSHNQGSGYDISLADQQMRHFFSQYTAQEMIMYQALTNHINFRRIGNIDISI
jgi:hypothetical protein